MKKKGQFAMLAIISFLLSVLIFIALYPVFEAIVDIASGSVSDPTTLFVIRILPFFALFALILFLFNSISIRGG